MKKILTLVFMAILVFSAIVMVQEIREKEKMSRAEVLNLDPLNISQEKAIEKVSEKPEEADLVAYEEIEKEKEEIKKEPEEINPGPEEVQPAGETIEVVATAYYGPEEGQSKYATGTYWGDLRLNGNGLTKTEKEARIGHIAADWNVLPQGTKVYVPGYGKAVVEDIGGAIQGCRIDLFMGYGETGLERAEEFGRQKIEIEVLEWSE